jgi:putative DNA primase/helicase
MTYVFGGDCVSDREYKWPIDEIIDVAQPLATKRKTQMKANGLNAQQASQILPKQLAWLWPGRFARNKISYVVGDPGLGKSQVGIDMAARVSAGKRWPCCEERARRGDVLLITAEDGIADTILPRLEAAGADLNRVHIVDSVLDYGGTRPFSLIADVGRLDGTLRKLEKPRLLIIDPINACLQPQIGQSFSANSVTDVRALFTRLDQLATRHRVAIICISHFTKTRSGSALARITGSFAATAAVRSAFTVTRDNRDPARRIFAPAKNNLSDDSGALAFCIKSKKTARGICAPYVRWYEPTSDLQ